MNPWIDSKDWRDTWEEVKRIPGGGQGQGRLVKSRNTSEVAFLKTLIRQNDPERRARFFREATAYSTCSHRGLPQLIETNAHKHSLSDYKLFIATEFISGSTMSRIINDRGPSSFEDALKTTQSLLEVIDYYHRANWVHRDIKPDNVILRCDDANAPVLVDFGLGFRDGPDEAFRTEHGQELGNRFLRLPELSVNSLVKQDARSDLACLAGILVFLLTGHSPAVLVDASGKLPHQRSEILDPMSV